MENIQNLDPKPGDVIRSNEDGLDYVVNFVGGAAAGVLIFRATQVLSDEFREWQGESYDHLDLTLLKKNAQNLDPEEVLGKLNENYQRAGKTSKYLGDTHFLEKLAGREGRFIRDMLLIGDSIEKFDMALIDMAKGLVGTSNKTWDAEQIYAMLSRYVPEDEFDAEFIKDFAIEFESRIQQSAWKTTKASTQRLDELLIPRVNDFSRSNFRLLQQINFGSGKEARMSSRYSGMMKAITNPTGMSDSVFLRDFLGGDVRGHSGTANLSRLLNKVFVAMGGKEAPEMYELFENRILSRAVDAMKDGNMGPEFVKKLSKMGPFQDVLNRYYEYRSPAQYTNRATTRQSFRNPLEEIIGSGQKAISLNQLRKMMRKDRKLGEKSFFSIDKDTFFENYLIKGHARFRDRQYDLRSQADREELYRVFGDPDSKTFLVSAKTIRSQLQQKPGGTADLDAILHQHLNLKKHLNDSTLLKIGEAHGINNHLTNRSNTTVRFRVKRTVDQKAYTEMAEAASMLDYSGIESRLPEVQDGFRRFYLNVHGDNLRHAESLSQLEELGPLGHISYADTDRAVIDPIRLINQATPLFDIPKVQEKLDNQEAISSISDYFKHKIPLHEQKIERVLGPVEGDLAEHYKLGYNSGKLAFASIRGTDTVRVISSDVPAPNGFEDILDRIDKVYDNKTKVGYFDLETAQATKEIREISLIDRNRILELQHELSQLDGIKGDVEVETKKLLKRITNPNSYEFREVSRTMTPTARKNNLTSLLSALDQFDVIVAKSGADYGFLLDEAKNLSEMGELTGIEYEEIQARIFRIRKNKALTSETIPMLTGHARLGETRQNYMTQKFLKKVQTHVSFIDNVENYQLTEMFGDEYKRIKSDITIQDPNKQKVLMVPGQNRVRMSSGDPLMLTGYRELAGGNIQIDYITTAGAKRTKTGKPAVIGAFMSNFEQFEPVSGFQDFVSRSLNERSRDLRSRNIEEMAERFIRDLNPSNSYIGTHQYTGGGDVLANSSARAHMYRVRYIASLVPDMLTDVPEDTPIDDLVDIYLKRPVELDKFRKMLDRLFIPNADMSDDMLEVIQGHVAEELAIGAANPSYRSAMKQMTYDLFDTGRDLLDIAMNPNTEKHFDALMYIAKETAIPETVKRETFHYSLNPGTMTGLRAKSDFRTAFDVDARGAVNGFVSELFAYPAARPDSHNANIARRLLKRAGMGDFEGLEDFGEFSGFVRDFFATSDGKVPLIHQDFEPTSHFARLTNQFMKDSPDIVSLMTKTFYDRAAQINDPGQRELITNLGDTIADRLHRAQRDFEGEGILGDQMARIVNKEVFDFIQEDPKARFDLLRQEYTEYQMLKNLSDKNWVKKVKGQVEEASFEDPDFSEKLQRAIRGLVELDENPTVDEVMKAMMSIDPRAIPKDYADLPPMLSVDQKDIPKVKMQAALMNRANSAFSEGVDSEETARVLRSMMNPGNFNNVKPLMALAAAGALVGVMEPDLDTPSAGNMSDDLQQINDLNRVSEMPGTQKGMGLFVGQTDPFKLNVSIRGFVKNAEERESIVREVFNAMNNTMEYRRVDDMQVEEHDRTPMIHHMRRNLL